MSRQVHYLACLHLRLMIFKKIIKTFIHIPNLNWLHIPLQHTISNEVLISSCEKDNYLQYSEQFFLQTQVSAFILNGQTFSIARIHATPTLIFAVFVYVYSNVLVKMAQL